MKNLETTVIRDKKILDIIFITDNNFSMPTGVAIQSLFYNRDKNSVYNIHVICNSVEEYNRKKLLKLQASNFNIDLVDVSETELHQKFVKENFPVSISATFKFFLPELFPNLTKALYIDGDLIIQSNLLKLYFTDISGVYAGVVKDYHALTFKGDVWKRLGVRFEAYFNSGVMLLNLEKMRNDHITEKLVEYRLNGINYYMDQDALNVVFGNSVKYLNFNYNMTMTNWRNKTIEDLAEYYALPMVDDKYDYLRNADIVHFASSDKPWVYYNTHYADVWFYYFLLSPFNETCLNRTSLDTIISSKEIKDIRIQKEHVCRTNYRLAIYPRISNSPAISVVVPVFNAEEYLEDCLSSIFNQTFGNVEVICVDDGSTDGSGKILDKWALEEARLKVIHQKNSYAGVARNNAIKMARGAYIVFIDADDVFAQNAFEAYYNSAIAADADVVVSSVYIFQQKLTEARIANNWLDPDYVPNRSVFSSDDNLPFIFNFTPGGPGGKCFKKDFIENKNLTFLSLNKSEDFYFIHLGIAEASHIAIIREPLYYIRTVHTSLEHRKDDMPLLFWEAIMLMKERLIADGIFDKVKQSFINENVNRFAYNLKTMETSDSYEKVLDKLREIYAQELGLGDYPRNYYYKQDNYEYLCKLLGIDFVSKQNEKVKYVFNKSNQSKDLEADLIRASWSYRIGRFITFIPRKIRGGIRCYKEHGISYTLGRIREKFIALFEN